MRIPIPASRSGPRLLTCASQASRRARRRCSPCRMSGSRSAGCPYTCVPLPPTSVYRASQQRSPAAPSPCSHLPDRPIAHSPARTPHADPPRVRHGQARVPGGAQGDARAAQRRAPRDHGPAPAAAREAAGRGVPARGELRVLPDGRERAGAAEALRGVQDDEVRVCRLSCVTVCAR